MRDVKVSLSFVVFALMVCIGTIILPKPAVAVPIAGTLDLFYHRFEGTIDPIDIDLGTGPVNTGVIQFSLDLTNPANQTQYFDFDSMTEAYSVDLLF